MVSFSKENQNNLKRDIKSINTIRKNNLRGGDNLPVNNPTWYIELTNFVVNRYPGSDDWVYNTIGYFTTRYAAERINNGTLDAKTYFTQMVTKRTAINGKGMMNLEDMFLRKDYLAFDSLGYYMMNDLQSEFFKKGDFHVEDVLTDLIENSLTYKKR